MGETTTVRRNSQTKDTFRRFIKNKAAVAGLIIIGLLILGAIFVGVLSPYDYDKQNLVARFEMPSLSHPLGTDEFGRDLLTRILYGARISLFVGILSVSVGCLIGGTLGALAAYYGGRVDNSIMRFLDIWHSIPDLLLAISLASAMGPRYRKRYYCHWSDHDSVLCPCGPCFRNDSKEHGIHRSGQMPGSKRPQDHSAAYHSQCPGADYCAGFPGCGRRHHHHGQSEFHRSGGSAADSGVGQHAVQRAPVHQKLLASGYIPRRLYHDDRNFTESSGRRTERCP